MTKISQLPQDTAPNIADQLALVDNANNVTKRITASDFSKIIDTLLNKPGDIKATACAAAPSGWLICDGSAISRATYSLLFTAIGTLYGTGNGTTTFNIPDFRGRNILGAGTGDATGATAHALGTKAGEETHTLTTGEMPSHTHSDSGHSHYINGYNSANEASGYSLWTGGNGFANRVLVNASGGQLSTSNSSNITNTGGGGAHNNLGPSLTVNVIIKT